MVSKGIINKNLDFETSISTNYDIDFFMANELIISSFRDEITSMEHPFFALKGGDKTTRRYVNGNTTVIVAPNAEYGMATIFDKDVWIYAISKLQESININKPISKIIFFTSYNFFITTNRTVSGRTYKELKRALERLAGTRITTNLVFNGKQESIGFGLLDSWRIIEEKKGSIDINMVEVILPEWLFQALHKKQVLKINSDYFRIRKPIHRRIYEIARKHCGNQNKFTISFDKLYLKIGSVSKKSEFKRMLKKLETNNDLPDYSILCDFKNDFVIFTNRNLIGY
ncbi:RepB family plasmid replication initiator protein (plasmid) [Candidatus Pantoea edessiphila]|uniref:RepB family plasmid replication initiator protein n=1 Tax=Candidatus Pantoea edessiphila TaxID=2044610 RepID=A0A2P5T156_9GAMM|nr:replication initiator protein A [Candidatus Pantoea edessiphila]PPI88317.1 RepB family plasmid replication initiator protein [Candidatus Pantoea edessiphila]